MRKTLLSTFLVFVSVCCMIFGVYAMGETRLGLQAQLDYQPTPYTIALDHGDGSANDTISTSYGETVNIPAPTRAGYTFTGWSASVYDPQTHLIEQSSVDANNVISLNAGVYDRILRKETWTPKTNSTYTVKMDVIENTFDSSLAFMAGDVLCFADWENDVCTVSRVTNDAGVHYNYFYLPMNYVGELTFVGTTHEDFTNISVGTIWFCSSNTITGTFRCKIWIVEGDANLNTLKSGSTTDNLTTWDGYKTTNTYFKNLTDIYNGNVILTANWVESNSVQNGSQNENISSTYSINYKDETGLNFSGTYDTEYPQTHTYGVDTTLVSPTKEGYTFEGWFLNEDCSGEPVTSLDGLDYSEDVTLYAKWVSTTPALTIKFVGLNATHEIDLTLSVVVGTGSLSDTSISVGESVKLTKEDSMILVRIAPSDTSHNYFLSWESQRTAFDADISQNGRNYTYNTDGISTLNIYVTEIYTISFDSNGGSGTAVESVNKVFGETASLPTNKFVKAGFTANGWNTKADGSGDSYTSTCDVNDNITLYSNWQAT